jgi:hypothetical protein
MTSIKKHWPLTTAVGMLWAATAVCLILSLKQNEGHFVYALDDPYIHMAMAKNFVRHGVWGVTKYGFTSSSSSLLWTLLLSLVYLIFGINEIAPFILNIIFGTAICILAYIILRKHKPSNLYIFLVLSAIIFYTPLPLVIFFGMEHALHALLTISFVYLAARLLTDENASPLESRLLLILTPLLNMARYEGLFLTFVVGCLFILKRKPLYALYLAVAGVLPIFIYGLVSVSNGWHLLPNSVLLKRKLFEFTSLSIKDILTFLYYPAHIIIHRYPRILMLMLGALSVFCFQYIKHRKIWNNATIMLIIFAATTFFHMRYTNTSWFLRHGAYIVALGILVVGLSICEYLPEKLQIKPGKKSMLKYSVLAFPVIFFALPVAKKGFNYLAITPQATTNIYEQQTQMGLFLRKFYQGKAIAANDIGAINYFADIKCLDLVGLANMEVERAITQKQYNSQFVDKITKAEHVKIAILYDLWFRNKKSGTIPSQWSRVGQWKIYNNLVCGSSVVSFYAVDPSEADNLIENLRAFSAYLPKSVLQCGKYTQQTERTAASI